jgi:hypothetical protein
MSGFHRATAPRRWDDDRMTVSTSTAVPSRARGRAGTLVVAALAGLLLGAVDLAGQLLLPYPWANLANSPAVWAAAAFALGSWVRAGRVRAMVAGIVLLLVAVEGYYLAATLVLGDDLANLWSPATVAWLVAGVLAGLVFGPAGSAWRGERWWPATIAVALLGAVFVAEAVREFHIGNEQTGAILAVLGLALVLLLGRSARQRLAGLAVLAPIAALGAVVYLTVGT